MRDAAKGFRAGTEFASMQSDITIVAERSPEGPGLRRRFRERAGIDQARIELRR
jgi:hypothetical protein